MSNIKCPVCMSTEVIADKKDANSNVINFLAINVFGQMMRPDNVSDKEWNKATLAAHVLLNDNSCKYKCRNCNNTFES